MRSKFCCAGLILTLCLPVVLSAQSCPDSIRSYRAMMQAVATLTPVLDTLLLRSNVHITVQNGRPARLGEALPAPPCRSAALWTSRGDSLIVHWIVTRDSVAVRAPGSQSTTTNPADQPHFLETDQNATFGSPDIMRSAIFAAARNAREQPRQPTQLVILVDTTGKAQIARLTASSGVRELDEAALRIYSTTQYQPARNDGQPIRTWLPAEVHWPRN